VSCPADLVEALARAGIVGHPRCEPLTGGVSSDIVHVRVDAVDLVAKRALAALRVATEWLAPVGRTAAEAAWLEVAATLVPTAVPRVYAYDEQTGYLLMAYLDPQSHPNWKAQLLAGQAEPGTAAAVGRVLGRLHAGTAARPELAASFAHDDWFDDLRLDPYLRHLQHVHPSLTFRLDDLIHRTATTGRAVVHGDVSPKNILVGPSGPVLLDAECATWGDPAFDVAFCLNHLLLKYAHVPAARDALAASVGQFLDAYVAEVDWEPVREVTHRVADLLPALLLARVDGKSPVEYLDEAERDAVRRVAFDALLHDADISTRVPGLLAGLAGRGA
jgi:5-methylthioribose kinase